MSRCKLQDKAWHQEEFLVAPSITIRFLPLFSMPSELQKIFREEEPKQRSHPRLQTEAWRDNPAAPQSITFQSQSAVDLLIGMDKIHYFSRDSTPKSRSWKKNLKVFHTKLGWMPCGTLQESNPSPEGWLQQERRRVRATSAAIQPALLVQPTLLVQPPLPAQSAPDEKGIT